MKKMKVLALVMVFLLSFSVVAMANSGKGNGKGNASNPSHEPKEVEVNFGGTMTVALGEEVTLTATTKKHGSSFEDVWTGADGLETVLVEDEEDVGYYVATASFDAKEVGVFEVTYRITMSSGNSHVTFVGEGTMTIIVIADDEDKYPAAPAVANELLKNAGIKNKYDGGNYITDVAREMGPGTDFNGVSKSNVEAYRDEVIKYLEGRGLDLKL